MNERFKLSMDAKTIYDLMRSIEVGKMVTYKQITDAIGRDARARRSAILAAIHAVCRDHRMVFECRPNDGYIRLSDEEIVGTGAAHIDAIRRKSRRGIQKLACANYADLPPEKKHDHNCRMTILALTLETTSADSVRRIEHAVKDSNAALPAGAAALMALRGIV